MQLCHERVAPGRAPLRAGIAHRFGVAHRGGPADRWLADTVRWAWRTRVLLHLGIDLRMRLRQAAEDEAVRVFAANLRDLLLAAPAGSRCTMGLDPGFRTGVKVAVIDATGKVVATGPSTRMYRNGAGMRHHFSTKASRDSMPRDVMENRKSRTSTLCPPRAAHGTAFRIQRTDLAIRRRRRRRPDRGVRRSPGRQRTTV